MPHASLLITPYYNGAPHIETAIYFMNAADNTSAYGSNTFIIRMISASDFFLTFNANARATEGTLTLTIIKLRDIT